ncbi:HNH endonuclease signature motif containing protein [Actinopolymorpha pittospori]|uniref:HNH nuclease domain-containing protein n=1 Tax=Actinopolymorpha pittospori TaxID=648752 RepID=A0A927MUY6_9ACTN|nr:HNH endonuclease signature motif containing protein [Actinopolymorpha pittospori]MBE1606689.1 hypothetical protein [Actinopolymorpha pittospori]
MDIDTGEGLTHPLMRWLAGVGEQIEGAVECPTLSLPLREYESALREIAVCEARLASLRSSLTRQAELNEVRKLTGAANTAGWVQQVTRMGRREASVSVRLAKALDQTIQATGSALSEGEISLGQAQVIERAIRRLPNDVDAAVRAEAEAFLLDSAQALDTDDLDKAGKHLYEVIAPEDAERRIGKQLEEHERRARESRTLSFGPVRDGMGTMFLRLDVPTLAILQALLDPLARPRPTGPDGPDLRSSERRYADAFAELLALAQAAASAPTRGSISPRLTVTMNHDDLANKLGYGTLNSVLTDSGPAHLQVKTQAGPDGSGSDERSGGSGGHALIGYRITGPPLSATLVRQLACDAEIIPVVLGGDGAVLDLGRGTRLFTYSQRHALAERDGYFGHFPECRRPEKWIEAHHIQHWVDGGATDLNNGVLLCQHHHTVIHTKGWTVRMGDDGHPEYIPPPWVDPYQNVIRPNDTTLIRR